jgi:SAM-dependent methyltransferase
LARQPRSKRQKKLVVRGSVAEDAELLDALALLQQRRAPYAEPLAAIVADVLEQFPLAPGGPIVEIGAGAGQLRQWLPPPVRSRIVHTDPSDAALRVFRQHAPEASTAVAFAEKLSFNQGECGGVLGLCVFDAIHAVGGEAAVVAELGRVLGAGGRFVHFLDMATLLEAPFRKLDADGLVPIPNVFGDPGDHEWPLDIVLFRRDWLTGLLQLALQVGHPLPTTFGLYFAAFLAQPFDVREAANLFKSVASNDELRQALATQLASACHIALRQGYPALAAIPFHSGKYLASVLETSFRNSDAFQIELSEIVARPAWRPLSNAGTVRYQSLCLGHQRRSDQFPKRILTESARARLASGDVPEDQALVEAGVFVFVARRV